jgi:hypothetical protein
MHFIVRLIYDGDWAVSYITRNFLKERIAGWWWVLSRRSTKKHQEIQAQIQMKVNTDVDLFNCCISLDNSCSVFLRCFRKRERV